jgi:Leucine-rich repeat (LRR) protein
VAELPASFAILRSLERLDLTNNDLSGLPAELGAIDTLKSIVLDGNPIRSIRRDVIARGTMAVKEHLRSKLEVDPDEHAHAAHVAVQADRAVLEALRTTKALNFSGQQADAVPASVWADADGADVASVVLSKNRLTTLPAELSMFSATLTSLDVSQNRL